MNQLTRRITLKAKTQHAANRIYQWGEIWEVVGLSASNTRILLVSLKEILDKEPGKDFFNKGFSSLRSIKEIDDPDFEIVKDEVFHQNKEL